MPHKFETEVLRFVRGEVLWRDLREVGINIDHQEGGAWAVSSSNRIDISPAIADFAKGVLKLWESEKDLREWAIILFACDFVSFSESEKDINWERFHEFLWDLAFGDKSKDLFTFVEQILTGTEK